MATKTMTIRRPSRRVMVVRPQKRHKKQFTIPLAVVAGFIPLGNDVYRAIQRGQPETIPNTLLRGMTGYDPLAGPNWGEWKLEYMKSGLLPILGGFAVHRVVGGWFGVNRALGAAGIPFIRI